MTDTVDRPEMIRKWAHDLHEYLGGNPMTLLCAHALDRYAAMIERTKDTERLRAEITKNCMSLALFIAERGLSDEYESWVQSRGEKR